MQLNKTPRLASKNTRKRTKTNGPVFQCRCIGHGSVTSTYLYAPRLSGYRHQSIPITMGCATLVIFVALLIAVSVFQVHAHCIGESLCSVGFENQASKPKAVGGSCFDRINSDSIVFTPTFSSSVYPYTLYGCVAVISATTRHPT